MALFLSFFLLFSFPLLAQEAAAQEEIRTFSFFDEMMHMFFVLGAILLVLLLAVWALKRMMKVRIEQINTDSQIKILEKRHLSAKSILYLVELHGKRYLLGEGSQGVISLGEVQQPRLEE